MVHCATCSKQQKAAVWAPVGAKKDTENKKQKKKQETKKQKPLAATSAEQTTLSVSPLLSAYLL